MNVFKTTLCSFGTYELFKFTVNLPFTLPRVGLDFLASKTAMVYSNVYASTKKGAWAGKK